MRLYEFANDDPLRVKLTAITSQLKTKYAGTGEQLSTDDFLTMLKRQGMVLAKSDLFDIVKKEPLKNIISDMNDNVITFKGDEQEGPKPGPDENEKIRQQMANKQANKPNPLG